MNNYDEEYEEFEDDSEQIPKKKKFNIFDWYFRDGKGVEGKDINALEKPSVANGFKLLWRRLGKLMSANLLFVFGNFPIFFIIIAMSGSLSETSYAPLSQQWGVIKGAMLFDQSPEMSVLVGLYGTKASVSVINTPTIVFFALGLLIILTLGFTKIGTTYIYRNIVLGEPIFPFTDFFYIIKRNIKRCLILGIIDALFIGMFAYNIYFLMSNLSVNTTNAIMLFFTVCMAIIYSFIRNYAYIMAFTFDLPLKKIIKNAVYFVMLGVKRNLVGLFFSIVVILLNVVIFLLYIPLGAILPFMITLSILGFIGVYAAYPNIDKYMVDHSKDNKSSEEEV